MQENTEFSSLAASPSTAAQESGATNNAEAVPCNTEHATEAATLMECEQTKTVTEETATKTDKAEHSKGKIVKSAKVKCSTK